MSRKQKFQQFVDFLRAAGAVIIGEVYDPTPNGLAEVSCDMGYLILDFVYNEIIVCGATAAIKSQVVKEPRQLLPVLRKLSII